MPGEDQGQQKGGGGLAVRACHLKDLAGTWALPQQLSHSLMMGDHGLPFPFWPAKISGPAILRLSFLDLLFCGAFAPAGEGKKLLARLAPVLPLPLSGGKLALVLAGRQSFFLILRCVVLLTEAGTFLAYGGRETPASFASAFGASFAKMFYVERRERLFPFLFTKRWRFL